MSTTRGQDYILREVGKFSSYYPWDTKLMFIREHHAHYHISSSSDANLHGLDVSYGASRTYRAPTLRYATLGSIPYS